MYRQKILTLVSEFATMTQLEDSYQRALGKPLPSVPAAVAWPIMKMNKMIRWLYVSSKSLPFLAESPGR
jgi:hypothetical protein